MKSFNFLEENFSHSFEQWVNMLAVKTGSNIYTIYPQLGNGTLQVFNIEPGLQVRLWNAVLKENVLFNRKPQTFDGGRSFTIMFYITPEAVLHKNSKDDFEPINKIWNTVLLSGNAALELQILAEREVKMCGINLSLEWAMKNLSENSFSNLFNTLIPAGNEILIFESATAAEYKMINEMFNINSQKLLGDFFIHSCTLCFLNDFFTKLNLRNRDSILKKYYFPVIAEVEKRIACMPDNHKTTLKQLSKEFLMSPSTLKRNFKKMFGKNISEYFRKKNLLL